MWSTVKSRSFFGRGTVRVRGAGRRGSEEFGGSGSAPAAEEDARRQPGVEVGESAPFGEEGDVELKGALGCFGRVLSLCANGAEVIDVGGVLGVDGVEVPPLADALAERSKVLVRGAEEVHVRRETTRCQRVDSLLLHAARCHPHPWRDRTQTETGEYGAQLVAPVPLEPWYRKAPMRSPSVSVARFGPKIRM